MTPIARAYEAGRAARAAGWYPTDNPYGDWELGVAWATGWHAGDAPKPGDDGMLRLQASLIPLPDNEGCCPRVGGGA